MGEERVGFPSDFFLLLFLLPCSEKKRMVNEKRMSTWYAVHIHEKVKAAKRKSRLQDIGIYTVFLQILTFEYKKSVGLSCL